MIVPEPGSERRVQFEFEFQGLYRVEIKVVRGTRCDFCLVLMSLQYLTYILESLDLIPK